MSNDTVLMPHERGWAVLRNGMLTKVYPSRHLAMQKLKDEMSRRPVINPKTHPANGGHAARRRDGSAQQHDHT